MYLCFLVSHHKVVSLYLHPNLFWRVIYAVYIFLYHSVVQTSHDSVSSHPSGYNVPGKTTKETVDSLPAKGESHLSWGSGRLCL